MIDDGESIKSVKLLPKIYLNVKLINFLRSTKDGEKLSNSLEKIKENATNILEKIIEVFPEYTPHNIQHKERVLQGIELLIPVSLVKQMNIYEIFFLVAATYLHDIGMAHLPELQIPREFNNSEKMAKYIRDNHHERTEKFVVDNFKDLGIEDIHQAKIIGRIARGHRKENLQDSSLYETDRMYGTNNSINMPLLTSLLRIGDELDLTFERTPMIIYEHKPPRDKISNEEWIRHIETSGVGISKEDPLILKCNAECSEPKIHRSLKRLEDKINDELDDLPHHLHYYKDCRKDLPRKFVMNITPNGYTPYDLKFSLKEKAIVNLLMGEKLYQESDESVRELIKNSLDGCRLLLDETKDKQNYHPEIIISYFSDESKLEISDNGIGMDEETIERYFTKIGQSFYRSSEFNEEQHGFTPVGELGIGILSCFMLAKKIVVNTKKNDSESLSLEIDDISDYFIVKNGDRMTTGTTVILELKDKIKKDFDILKIVKKYARHIEIPIRVRNNNVEEIVTPKSFMPDMSEITNVFHDAYKYHTCVIDNEFVKGYVAFLGINDDSSWRPISSIHRRDMPSGKSEISIEGIFVSSEKILPPWISMNVVDSDLNIKNRSIDLNVARNQIIKNEKLKNLKSNIEKIILEDLDTHLKNIEKESNDLDQDVQKTLSDFFSNYVNSWYLYNEDNYEIPDQFKEFVKKFYITKFYSDNQIQFSKIESLLKLEKPITIFTDYFRENEDEYILHVIKHANEYDESEIFVQNEYRYSDISFSQFSEKISRMSISTKIVWNEKRDLDQVIPKTWKLVEFPNYTSTMFFEDLGGQSIQINYKNRFVQTLVNNLDLLSKQNFALLVEGFFKTVRMNVKQNFSKVLDQQKEILKILVNEERILESNSHEYILNKEDFPKHFFKNN